MAAVLVIGAGVWLATSGDAPADEPANGGTSSGGAGEKHDSAAELLWQKLSAAVEELVEVP